MPPTHIVSDPSPLPAVILAICLAGAIALFSTVMAVVDKTPHGPSTVSTTSASR
jgi:hypothetical protein